MLEPSATDKIAMSIIGRVFTAWVRHKRRKELLRSLSEPIYSPLSRRYKYPSAFEDQNGTGSVSFAIHEDNLKVIAKIYGGTSVSIELDNWNARALCLYIKHIVEGFPFEG